MDYSHAISMDPGIWTANVARCDAYKGKVLFVEVRTNFLLKEEESAVFSLDSEIYHVAYLYEYPVWTVDGVRKAVCKRLMDYGMGDDAIQSLSEEILHLAREKRDEVDYVVPIALEVQVCTVKQEGESSHECRDRAIQTSKLVPLRFCTYARIPGILTPPTFRYRLLCHMNNHKFILSLDDNVNGSVFCRWCSKYTKLADHVSMSRRCSHGRCKFRVEDPGPCHVCPKDIKLGQHISAVPTCLHIFHSICILGWMDKHTLVCPKCLTPAYDPPKS